jgi:hypothetical protein
MKDYQIKRAQYQGTIEAMIDDLNVQSVTDMMVLICYEKAAHVRENWQDEGLARLWDKAAAVLDAANDKLQKLGSLP